MNRIASTGLFILAAGYTVYFARPVLLPLILALLVTLVVKPVHRFLEAHLRLPAPLAAFVVMIAVTAGTITSIGYLSRPAVEYTEEFRGDYAKERLRALFQPINRLQGEIKTVAAEVEDLTGSDEVEEKDGAKDQEDENHDALKPGDLAEAFERQPEPLPAPMTEPPPKDEADEDEKNPRSPPPVKVQIREDPIDQIYAFAQEFSIQLLLMLVLVFFFLAFGDTMIRRLAEVDLAANLIDDLTREVSSYLFTISAINAGLGVATGLAMWALGMPNPVLWGTMAALFNFIPYIGAAAGTIIVLMVAAVTFETASRIVPVPLVYYCLTAIEGNFITPYLIGRRFTINPIIVFVWVVCWGTMWGIPGMLIALPLLMMFRIVCSRLPSLSRLERVISA